MRLSSVRFVKIEGTQVMVSVTSAAEAKTALKELRHKKKEYNLLKRSIVRQQKRESAKRPRAVNKNSFWYRIFDKRKVIVAAVLHAMTLLKRNKSSQTKSRTEQDLKTIEEILHNLDSCILQIEGKLISLP